MSIALITTLSSAAVPGLDSAPCLKQTNPVQRSFPAPSTSPSTAGSTTPSIASPLWAFSRAPCKANAHGPARNAPVCSLRSTKPSQVAPARIPSSVHKRTLSSNLFITKSPPRKMSTQPETPLLSSTPSTPARSAPAAPFSTMATTSDKPMPTISAVPSVKGLTLFLALPPAPPTAVSFSISAANSSTHPPNPHSRHPSAPSSRNPPKSTPLTTPPPPNFIPTPNKTQPPPATPFAPINQFQLLDAYAGINLHGWLISFGNQSLSWGPGLGGALLFCGQPPAHH